MRHEEWAVKLGKIAARAARENFPGFDVVALHVFGSYSRGAPEPGDLDLILTVDNVDYQRYTGDHLGRRGPTLRGEIRRRVLAHVQPVDLHIRYAGSADWTPEEWDPKLVWSPEFSEWELNLARIPVDPSAGHFERDHVIDVKKSAESLSSMELAMVPIRAGQIAVRRIPIDPAHPPPLPPGTYLHGRWQPINDIIERWRPSKKVLEAWPFALYWLAEESRRDRLGLARHDNDEHAGNWTFFKHTIGRAKSRHLCSTHSDRHILIGEPSVTEALKLLWHERVTAVALLPSINRRKHNEIVVLRPTESWLSCQRAQEREWDCWRKLHDAGTREE